MQKRGKKAQAATEFLTTYGWAILILIVIIVALASLGVFRSPQIPNFCASVAPITCSDVKIYDSSDPDTLINNIEFIMSATGSYEGQTNCPPGTYCKPTVTAVSLKQPSNINCVSITGNPIESGSTQIACTLINPLNKKDLFSGTITIQYTQKGELPHTLKLDFSGTAE